MRYCITKFPAFFFCCLFSFFSFFFSLAVCHQIQWTPFLKFPNKYRIYTCCLHYRPSTFPHADVTVQGEGYLNSSISCIYVHAHTHTFQKHWLSSEWQGCTVRCPWKFLMEAAEAELAVMFSLLQVTKLTRVQFPKWVAYTFHIAPLWFYWSS